MATTDLGTHRGSGGGVMATHTALVRVDVSPFCYFGVYTCYNCGAVGVLKDIRDQECPHVPEKR